MCDEVCGVNVWGIAIRQGAVIKGQRQQIENLEQKVKDQDTYIGILIAMLAEARRPAEPVIESEELSRLVANADWWGCGVREVSE